MGNIWFASTFSYSVFYNETLKGPTSKCSFDTCSEAMLRELLTSCSQTSSSPAHRPAHLLSGTSSLTCSLQNEQISRDQRATNGLRGPLRVLFDLGVD